MQLSDNGIDKLIEWEGCRLYPYDDRTSIRIRHWIPQATIGIGHLIAEEDWSKYADGITLKYAIKLFQSDIIPREEAVNKFIKADINQNQFDACVSLCYNIGRTNFRKSSAVKFINDPEFKHKIYKNLESAWKAWHKSNGKSHVLDNRRLKEWCLYEKNI